MAVTGTLDHIPGLKQFRVIQEERDLMVVQIVAGAKYSHPQIIWLVKGRSAGDSSEWSVFFASFDPFLILAFPSLSLTFSGFIADFPDYRKYTLPLMSKRVP